MKTRIAAATLLAAAVPVTAVAASAQKTTGTVYATPTHTEGKDLYVSGDLKDKVLGRGAIVYVTNVGANADGSVRVTARRITVYFPNGSLTGTGAATQTIAGQTVTVKDGTFKLTKGTGKLKGRTLTGTFGGDQKDGVYKFAYKATLK